MKETLDITESVAALRDDLKNLTLDIARLCKEHRDIACAPALLDSAVGILALSEALLGDVMGLAPSDGCCVASPERPPRCTEDGKRASGRSCSGPCSGGAPQAGNAGTGQGLWTCGARVRGRGREYAPRGRPWLHRAHSPDDHMNIRSCRSQSFPSSVQPEFPFGTQRNTGSPRLSNSWFSSPWLPSPRLPSPRLSNPRLPSPRLANS